jgi:broad specificity phosphatase PhoE
LTRSEADGVRILVVRHAQQQRDGDDGPLTALGEAQAAATAPAVDLTSSDRLVSSNLLRAVETATALGRSPERFRDLDEFRFGQQWSWAQADDREDLALWRPEDRVAGGESLHEFQARVEGALRALLRDPPTGRLVLVVHSGVLDAVVRWAFGLGPDTAWTTEVSAPHASITEFEHWPKGRHPTGAPRHTVLVRLGDISHLPPDLISGG